MIKGMQDKNTRQNGKKSIAKKEDTLIECPSNSILEMLGKILR